MRILKTFVQLILLVSIIVFGVGYFKRDTLPQKEQILDSLYQKPLQEEIKEPWFEVSKDGVSYKIYPKYDYQFYGLIVTQYNSENWLDISHKEDPLNTKDICAVWGNNLKTGIYQEAKFSHGEFTCFWRFKKSDGTFSPSEISNSHLLPANDQVYQKIKESQVGDQVYFKGYLADYAVITQQGELRRTTSITRNDTGNGACEVVYVTDFQILKKTDSIFPLFYKYSKYVIVISLIFLIILFIMPSDYKEEF
ncbi:MAG: hypothetical protein ABH956_01325 [Candidatus Nealsonbacteria bacterium]